MKKRIFACILLLLITLPACTGATQKNTDTAPTDAVFSDPTGYKVVGPLTYPDYTFTDEPTTDELRETAVRAMHDLLSIRWSTATEIAYKKTGPASGKRYYHAADTTYAGVLYSNASAGLFHFMEFYDQETGRFYFPGTIDALKQTIGSSCADALIWSWNTVCTSIDGLYYPSTMLYKNGYYPVGSYTYDFSATNYTLLPTTNIIKENGKDVIIDAYCQVLPADALVSTSDNHAMMAIEAAHVVRNADGTVNTAESYIVIQDQRGGNGAGFYEQVEDYVKVRYSGRTSAVYSFNTLYAKNYLPVTAAEFLGEKAYEKAAVTCSNTSCESLDDLLAAQIQSNYPLVMVNAFLVYPDGGNVLLERKTFGGSDRGGVPKTFLLGDMEQLSAGTFKEDLKPHNTYTVQIEVVVSTGERFIAAELPLRN